MEWIHNFHRKLTHGLYVQHIEKRSVRLPDLSVQTILGELRRLWADIPHAFNAILARPPAEAPATVHFIIEFLDYHRMPIPGTTPVLRRIFDAPGGAPQITSAYHVGGVNPYLLAGQVPLRHRCEPWGQHRCTVRRNGEILLPMSRAALEEGDFLDFSVHEQVPSDSEMDDGTNLVPEEGVEDDPDGEALSLMQRAVSRSPRRTTPMSASSHEDESRVSVHTFRMSASYKRVVLVRSQEMTYIPQLTRLWQVPRHNPLLAVHQVWHGPTDLEDSAKATLLLELASDRNRQAIADDQMVLVDIALESSGDSTTIRRVLWTRRFMTRPSFLHLLSVQEFCNSPAADCHVERNKVTWPKQDTISREFHSGDYVRLLVRGPPSMTPAQVQVVLCEQEGADAQRYVFTRSPSHSPEPSAHLTEGAESESEIFHDSPIENITPAHQKEEKSPLQEWTNRSLIEKSSWEEKGKNHQRQGGGKENACLSQGYPVSCHQPVLKPPCQ